MNPISFYNSTENINQRMKGLSLIYGMTSPRLTYLQPGEMWQTNDFWETQDGPEVMTQERLDFLYNELGWPFTHVSEFMMEFKPRRYVGGDVES